MEINNGYVVLDATQWAELMALGIDEVSQFLTNTFTYDSKNNVYYALDSDEISDFFFEQDLVPYYNGGWYLKSTKWVDEV